MYQYLDMNKLRCPEIERIFNDKITIWAMVTFSVCFKLVIRPKRIYLCVEHNFRSPDPK